MGAFDIIKTELAIDAARQRARYRDAAAARAIYSNALKDARAHAHAHATPDASTTRTAAAPLGREIRARGAVIRRTADGCTIVGRHLTVRRRQEIVKLVRGGASDREI